MSLLKNKKILLGICGGIAAYKCAELVRQLTKIGAVVRVVMTNSAKQFITPMTLQALSGDVVRNELFDAEAERAMGHIELARWADYILIAPATANFLAKMAHGLADDLLSTLYLATTAPVFICPAMNSNMWEHAATRFNLQTLIERGVKVIGPAFGEQACGDVGYGRMSEVEEIIAFFTAPCLLNQHVLITAGPTREAIDPVRYISNHSSGKMGYALAQACVMMGAKVTLVSGPTALKPPTGAKCCFVNSAQEMFNVVMHELQNGMIFIGAAAVADYAVLNPALTKLKKQDLGESMQISLTKTQDLLASVVQTKKASLVVGFAAETNHLLANAKSKLMTKGVDMIIANDVSNGQVFDSDQNKVSILTKKTQIDLPLSSKTVIAQQIVAIISTNMQNSEN